MIRLFVALDLPPSLRTQLSFMAGGLPGARWTPPENYHVTLRFIGEVPPYQAEEADAALSALRAPGFQLTLAGVGTFSKGGRGSKATSLWAGVERTPALEHLQSKVETALQRAGFEPERRRFSPHVTLARTDQVDGGKLAGWVASHNLFRARPVPVEHFTLFSSRRSKEASSYTPEVDYPLAPMGGREQDPLDEEVDGHGL